MSEQGSGRVAAGGDPRSFAIIGAAMEVHCVLGPGFLESVYSQALAVEMDMRGIAFAREVALPVRYKGTALPAAFRADFICFDDIIVEVKALGFLRRVDEAQTINYLKASGLAIGLLINFGVSRLDYRRLIWSGAKTI